MKAIRTTIKPFLLLLAIAALAPVVSAQTTYTKANNTTALSSNASWVGGTAQPGSADIALWDSTAGANSSLLGGDLSWKGIQLASTAGAVTIGGATNTLTLGTSGITSNTTNALTLSSLVRLTGGNQTWSFASTSATVTLNGTTITNNGNTLTLDKANVTMAANLTGSGGLAKTGGGSLVFRGSSTYTGNTTLTSSNLQLDGGGSISASSIITGTGSTLIISKNPGVEYTFANTITGGINLDHRRMNTETITGSNNYTGSTAIRSGALSVSSLNSITTNATLGTVHSATSNLGAPTTVGAGTIGMGYNSPISDGGAGMLIYTGTGETTDRVIDLLGFTFGGTLDQSGPGPGTGTGLLKFTSNVTATGVGSKTLTLQGSTAGTGELAGAIVNNSTTGSTYLMASFSSGASSITLASVDGVSVGASISSATGIAGGTTITGINTTTKVVTLSANTTAAVNYSAASPVSMNVTNVVNLTSLTKAGTGTWTLSGNNSYTGVTTVNAGTLTLNRQTGSLVATNALTMGGTGTFNIDNVGATGALSQSLGALTFSAGDGTVRTTRTAAQDVALTFSSMAARSAGATGNFVHGGGTNSVTNGIVLTGVGAGFIDQGMFFGGSNYAYMDGAGTFVRGINYGVDAGTQTSGGGASLASASGTQAEMTGNVTAQTTDAFTTLKINGNNDLTLAASQTLTVNGVLKSGNTAGGATISGGTGIQSASGAELVIRTDGANDALTISSQILANTPFTKSGAGTLTLSGNNTYTGNTTVGAGVLNIQNASALGAVGAGNGTSVTAGAALQLQGGITTLAEDLTLNGSGISNDGALRNISGNNTYAGLLTMGSSAARINSDADTLTLSNTGQITGVFDLTVGGAGNTTIRTVIGTLFGAGTLTKDGAGILTLTGGNFYSGLTTVNAGTLAYGVTNALNNGAVTVSGGTLALSTFNDTVGAVTLSSGSITSTTGTLTGTSYSLTDSGSVSAKLAGAAVALTKTGAGTATLSGNNTYGGGTTVTSGTLVLAHNNAAGTAGIVLSGDSSSTLQIDSGMTISNNITFSNTNAGSSVSRLVANAAAYTVGTSGNLTSAFFGGQADTTAGILAGTNAQGSTATLAMRFSDTSAATNDGVRQSDVFSLSGTSTDLFVLQLNVTGLDSSSFLGWLNGGSWVNAVSGNSGNNASGAQQGYLGSFSAFQGTYGSTLTTYVGAYGVDISGGSTWAVLNHNSDYAVIPEPSTWVLLAFSLTTLMILRRRRA